MPLVPPQRFRKVDGIHRIGLSTAKPAASDVLAGTLYFSTDLSTLERSNGTIWEVYGSPGPPGPQGDPGPAGGILEDQWTWIAAATPPTSTIGASRIAADNDNVSLATVILMNKLAGSSAGIDWSVVISSMVTGDRLYFQKKGDGTLYNRYTLTGAPTLNGTTTWRIPVVWSTGTGEPANGVDVIVAFQRLTDFQAHHTTHETGGSDQIVSLDASVINSGILANARLPVFATPTFNAADFTTIIGTWTVTTLFYNTYMRIGNLLVWSIFISASTLSSGTNNVLLIKLPAGMTTPAPASSFQVRVPFVSDAAGPQQDYLVSVGSSNQVQINRVNSILIPSGTFGIEFTIMLSVN